MAKIHVLLAGQKLGTHPMSATPWIVGRHSTCHIQIDNAGISRRHCKFTYDNGAYHVEDMQSANGVFVNGKKVRRAPVENGMEVGIGKYVLIFEDTGLELPPGQGGGVAKKPAAAPAGFSGAQRTFQVDGRGEEGGRRRQGLRPGRPARAEEETRRMEVRRDRHEDLRHRRPGSRRGPWHLFRHTVLIPRDDEHLLTPNGAERGRRRQGEWPREIP